MPDRSALDERIVAAVAARRPQIEATIEYVHGHPELAHEEHLCAAHLAELLAAEGFRVELGVAGMDTAFTARLAGARPGARVGLAALYDAVPAVTAEGGVRAVHSCGHGPIAAAVTGAALALAGLDGGFAGEVMVVGCPADEIHAPQTVERGGGKFLSAEAGLWDEVDAALYAHPEFKDTVWLRSRWMRRQFFSLFGTRSLRDDVDQPPIEAIGRLLDACGKISRNDLMVERVVLDGDVEEDTGLALTGSLLFFGDTEAAPADNFANLAAALPELAWTAGPLVAGVRPDDRVAAAVADAFAAAGRGFEPDPGLLPFATDFGNITQRVPAALIGIGRPEGWSFHTEEGADQFASADGVEAAMQIATVLALATARLTDPATG
ncbi:MAG TPA: M20/M25/M40 family metallo-hydrolase [Solirubrobacterales bacterium]|nr:M20/M25/M40 family metallo-hydrolase [Solirubrobacterales bacterium]